MNPIAFNGVKNILRNRYRFRKRGGSFYEYNESITVIPEEFAEQDEYKREKLLNKLYESRHQHVLKTKEKLYSIPVPKLPDLEEAKDQMKGFEKYKQATDDMPVKLKTDPFKSSIRKCIFCTANLPVDYKNTQLLSQFISPQTGIMFSQQVTGLCAHKYDEVAKAITKSKRLGLMPYFFKESTYVTDPKLFDAGENKLKLIPDNLDKRKLNSD